MSPTSPIQVSCELDSLEPLSGRVRDARGRVVSFAGWVELAAALAAVTRDAPSSTADPEEDHP